jgi:hypothetical protein
VYRLTYFFVALALVAVAILAIPIFIVSFLGVGLVLMAALFL